jgi:cytoskeletal protein RodZ
MKRWIFWILLPILTVGAIALAIVLLWGSGFSELQPGQPTEAPAALNEDSTVVPQETSKPEAESPETTEKPSATDNPVSTEKPEVTNAPAGEATGEKTNPTPAPTSPGEPEPTSTPSPTPAPVVPAGDEDELPLMP